MKTRIKSDDSKDEPVVDFWLERDDDGDINLLAEVADSRSWRYIATISADTGKMELSTGIGSEMSKAGLLLDNDGRIKLTNSTNNNETGH